MENLSLHDAPSGGGPNNVHHTSPGPQQLPPQTVRLTRVQPTPQLRTISSRTAEANECGTRCIKAEKLLLVLRDGRKLIGVLRSWDQFANLVLQDTVERIFVQDIYADISRGIFLVRGENVLLLGEIDLDKDDYIPEPYRKASAEEVHALSVRETQERKGSDKTKQSKLQELGFEVEHAGEILL